MKKVIVIQLLILISFSTPAQITFQSTYGGPGSDFPRSLQQTTDGGYIITGVTGSFGSGAGDIYLVKTDSIGNLVWTKTFGGTTNDYSYSVKQTSDGGYIVAGFTDSFGSSNYDVYLIRTNSIGDTLWTKIIGGPGNELATSVQQTSDSGFIFAGSAFVNSPDIYLIKTNSNGDVLWTKTFEGQIEEAANSVSQTTDGGFIVAGYSIGFGNDDAILLRTDANGNLIWLDLFDDTGFDNLMAAEQTNDGGFVAAGYANSFGVGLSDFYLIKTDSNGYVSWAKTYGGPGNDGAYSMQVTSDGGYILSGYSDTTGGNYPSVCAVKTDINGDLVWAKVYGGANVDNSTSVSQTSDDGFVITGGTKSFGSGNFDFYLIKTDSNGNSGCNEANATTIVTSVTPSRSNLIFSTSSMSNVTVPATIIGTGGVGSLICSSLKVDETKRNKEFSINPNPTTGEFNLSFEGIEEGRIEIINAMGAEVFSSKINQDHKSSIAIDLSNESSGIYIVAIHSSSGITFRKLILN